MKIQKYTKTKNNIYKVLIDGEEYSLYDDIIVKYGLILKGEISDKDLKKILQENEELKSYYMAIRYINKKLRSEKEITQYLEKKNIAKSTIDKTIKRLRENHFLNDEVFLKAYINDQMNLTNNGPKKILKNLIILGIDEEAVNSYLGKIDSNVLEMRISKYIDKKIATNHKASQVMLKKKILVDLVNLGYEKEMILGILAHRNIEDKDIYQKEYEKCKKQLQKKYEGYELERKIKEKMYRKGFYYQSEGNYEE